MFSEVLLSWVFHSVRPEGAAGLTEHLTPESSSSPQTGIFTLTINGPGGKTSKLSVSNNERQAVFRYTMLEDRVNMGLLDLICLHRYVHIYTVKYRQNSEFNAD